MARVTAREAASEARDQVRDAAEMVLAKHPTVVPSSVLPCQGGSVSETTPSTSTTVKTRVFAEPPRDGRG